MYYIFKISNARGLSAIKPGKSDSSESTSISRAQYKASLCVEIQGLATCVNIGKLWCLTEYSDFWRSSFWWSSAEVNGFFFLIGAIYVSAYLSSSY